MLKFLNSRIAAAALVSAIGITGCGGSSGDTESKVEESTSTVAASKERQHSEEEMKAALLGIEDLPTGWTVDRDDHKNDEDSGKGFDICNKFNAKEIAKPHESADITFSGKSFPPTMMSEIVVDYDSEEDARKIVTVLREALGACTEFTMDMNGTPTKFTVEPMSLSEMGETRGAGHLEAEGVSVDIAYIQDNDIMVIVMNVTTGSIGGADEKVIRKAVEKADAKLVA